ncbi:MAG: hypothetical protein HRT88_11490 [Lentisphaeraceae bacterium]|nr:hypothetical protein [Lentisphaeraceae bacterium]
MKIHFYDIAFDKMASGQKYNFDDQTEKIRKVLMFYSSMMMISVLLNPLEKTKSYEVNLGLIKGTIVYPWILYGLMIVMLLYYLIYYVSHLKKVTIDNCANEFHQSLFYFYLTEVKANNEYFDTFKDEHGVRHGPLPSVTFTMSGGGAESIYPVHSIQENINLDSKNRALLEANKNLKITDQENGFKLQYEYEPTIDDFTAFNVYKDKFMRYRVVDWLTAIFPIYFANICLLVGVIKAVYIAQM